MSLFDLIGMEDKMTRYAAQRLPNQKVTRKLIEEIYSSPPTPPRPNPVKLRPSKYAQLENNSELPKIKGIIFVGQRRYSDLSDFSVSCC